MIDPLELGPPVYRARLELEGAGYLGLELELYPCRCGATLTTRPAQWLECCRRRGLANVARIEPLAD